MEKPWYQSKTLWVNILTLLALILGTVHSGQSSKRWHRNCSAH